MSLFGGKFLQSIYKDAMDMDFRISDLLQRHWFPLLLVHLFALGVIFRFHGGSVQEWDTMLSEGSERSFWHVGKSRSIRVDDWRVSQPFIFAQCRSPEFFPRINKCINKGMDMSIQTPSAPVWDLTAVGQLHNWGYFAFGPEVGSSWSWWVRFLGIPFFAYFFLLLWCNGDRASAIVGAMAITLGAPTQWWDTTMPYHLMYFFSVLMSFGVVCRSKKLVMVVFGGMWMFVFSFSFFMVMYPPFEVLLLPALFILMAFVFKEQWNSDIKWVKIFVLTVVATLLICECFYFYVNHREGLAIVSGSSYPGSRRFSGGSWLFLLRRSLQDVLSLFTWDGKCVLPGSNPCELSDYMSLTIPVCVGMVLTRRLGRKIDSYELAMLMVCLIYIGWVAFKWPVRLATMSGLNLINPSRASVIEGFLMMLLALRLISTSDAGIAMFRIKPLHWVCLIIICITPRVIALIGDSNIWQFYNKSGEMFVRLEMGIILASFAWCGLIVGEKKLFLPALFLFSFVTGAFVHPLGRGLSPLFDKSMVREMIRINQNNPGVWWSNESGIAQIPVALGFSCWSGTQQYCDTEFWKAVDPGGRFKPVWNRYAHRYATGIGSDVVCDNKKRLDAMFFSVNEVAIRKLEINYLVWKGRPLTLPWLKELASFGKCRIYEVEPN